VRAYDISDAFRPRDVAHFVPPPPNTLVDPRPGIKLISHSADVYVTRDGFLYVTDYNGGLYVLEYES